MRRCPFRTAFVICPVPDGTAQPGRSGVDDFGVRSQAGALRDRHRIRSAAVAVFGVAFLLWRWTGAGGETVIQVADNVSQTAAAWLAGVVCM